MGAVARSIILAFQLLLLFGCKETCAKQFTQQQLDVRSKEFLDPNTLQFVQPGSNKSKPVCRYLDKGEKEAEKIFDSFTFIDSSRYHVYVCEHEQYSRFVANPKYLKSHIEKLGDHCVPKFNPLDLRSYSIEYSKPAGELRRLRTMAE